MARLLSDVDIGLGVDDRGEIIVHRANGALVKNAVGVVLGTLLCEVPFLPQVGNTLYLQSFNFQHDTAALQSSLQHEIEMQVPGALVNGVRVVSNPHTRETALSVGVSYSGEPDLIEVLSEGQLPRFAM